MPNTEPTLAALAPNAAGAPIIEAHGLVKRYGRFAAVDGVDLFVDEREVFGILGPNGAGKTTTLEMIEGLRTPDAGEIRVGGFNAVVNSEAVRTIIGVQLQSTALFDYLSAAELIELFAGLYGVPAPKTRIDELLAMVGLEEKRGSRVEQLSGGQQQRLSIALALVNNPRVVFLDEPTTGLDPQARRNLWETIRDVRNNGTTVILTTHYMEEAEQLCDRVAIMDRGRVIACDTPAALIRGLGIAATIRATIAAGHLAQPDLLDLPGVTAADAGSLHHGNGAIVLRTTDVQTTLVGLLALAARRGARLTDLTSTQASLEDVFLSLTGRRYEDETEPSAVSDQPSAR